MGSVDERASFAEQLRPPRLLPLRLNLFREPAGPGWSRQVDQPGRVPYRASGGEERIATGGEHQT
jgi:hypothetical protein